MAQEGQDPPKQDARGRFVRGNKAAGSRKGIPNKYGPTFRDKLMAGIDSAGLKKAKKNGVNVKVDGLTYLVEDLVQNNSSAAATLIAKLIPPELPPENAIAAATVNILPVESGQHYGPGNEVLLPGEECARAWTAFREGSEAWKVYLAAIEPLLTRSAFEKLSALEAPEPERHFTPQPSTEPEPPPISANVVRLLQKPKLTEADLEGLTDAEGETLARSLGYTGD